MFVLVLEFILFPTVFAGYFGKDCNETKCNVNCLPSRSTMTKYSKLSRNCIYGCVDGWYGKYCHKPCVSTCVNRSCFQDTGRCQDGCVTGWYGSKCNKPCRSLCSNRSCIQGSGRCSDGCVNGWYGETCSKPCKSTCMNMACLQSSGRCIDGCVTGWYGDKCNKPCSTSCFNTSCLQTSGYCSQGCILGLCGKMCELSCADTCQGNVCDKHYVGVRCNKTTNNVSVSNSSQYIGGLIGVVISLIIVGIIWIIRRFIIKGNNCRKVKISTTGDGQPNYDNIYNTNELDEMETNLYLDIVDPYEPVTNTGSNETTQSDSDTRSYSKQPMEQTLTDAAHVGATVSDLYARVIKDINNTVAATK